MKEISIDQVRTILDSVDLNYSVLDPTTVRLGFGTADGAYDFAVWISVNHSAVEMLARSYRGVDRTRKVDLQEAINAACGICHSAQAHAATTHDGALELRYEQRVFMAAAPTPVVASIIDGFIRTTHRHLEVSLDLLDARDGLDTALEELLSQTQPETDDS